MSTLSLKPSRAYLIEIRKNEAVPNLVKSELMYLDVLGHP